MYKRLMLAVIAVMLSLNAWAHEIGPRHEEPAQAEKQHAETAQAVDTEGIEAHIEDVVEHELEPIRAELARIRSALERHGVAEVVGGIGWIVGILGLIAYLKSRKK